MTILPPDVKESPRVVVLVGGGSPQNSIYWFDLMASVQWPRWMILRRLPDPRRQGLLAVAKISELRTATMVVTLHNSPVTRHVLFLKRLGLIPGAVVVLELNLKEESLRSWKRWVGRWIYSKAETIGVLAPSDRDLLRQKLCLDAGRIIVLEQWAQPDRFAEQEPQLPALRSIADSHPFAIAAGRSSRNYDELFQAAASLPDVRLVIAGCNPELVPAALSGRVHGVNSLPFEQYIWLLRRARFNVISLLPVRHTCGLRVWFQSLAVGTPVIISATEACAYYAGKGAAACLYPPGDAAQLARQMHLLWTDESARDQLVAAGRSAVARQFGAETYHDRILTLVGEKLKGRKSPQP